MVPMELLKSICSQKLLKGQFIDLMGCKTVSVYYKKCFFLGRRWSHDSCSNTLYLLSSPSGEYQLLKLSVHLTIHIVRQWGPVKP